MGSDRPCIVNRDGSLQVTSPRACMRNTSSTMSRTSGTVMRSRVSSAGMYIGLTLPPLPADADEALGAGRQQLTPVGRDHDVLFQMHPLAGGDEIPRLGGEDHAGLE